MLVKTIFVVFFLAMIALILLVKAKFFEKMRNSLKNFVAKALNVVSVIGAAINTLGFGAIHIYTVFVANLHGGGIAAVITFLFPPFSQLYWIYTIWDNTGIFWHPLSVFSGLLIALLIANFIFIMIFSLIEVWLEK